MAMIRNDAACQALFVGWGRLSKTWATLIAGARAVMERIGVRNTCVRVCPLPLHLNP